MDLSEWWIQVDHRSPTCTTHKGSLTLRSVAGSSTPVVSQHKVGLAKTCWNSSNNTWNNYWTKKFQLFKLCFQEVHSHGFNTSSIPPVVFSNSCGSLQALEMEVLKSPQRMRSNFWTGLFEQRNVPPHSWTQIELGWGVWKMLTKYIMNIFIIW